MPLVADPTHIDRYEIRGVLGTGAMGTVYRGWDPKLQREVAIKVVTDSVAREAKARERFKREAKAIAALKHPNVVEIYDFSGPESPQLYLVMERLQGDDLFNIMTQKGTLPEPAAAAVGHELCLALSVAHNSGVIHRDIKPENVFMDGAGRVVLTDFGVVKAIQKNSAVDGWGQNTEVVGTPGFMAPELMMKRSLGPGADIFAIGVLLYNVSTGELPFAGKNPIDIFRAVVSGLVTNPRKYKPAMTDEFIAVLLGCLESKPKDRFQSADVVRTKLKQVLDLHSVSDVRDDLRDFMRDPVKYGRFCTRRTVSSMLVRLKLAVKDHNDESAAKWRERLKAVDPQNEEVFAISGLLTGPAGDSKTEAREALRRRHRSRRSRRLLLGSAALAFLSVAASAAYWIWGLNKPASVAAKPEPSSPTLPAQPPRNGSAMPETAPATPEAATVLPVIDIEVLGGPASVSIDGKRIGRLGHRAVSMPAGEHVLEAKKKHKTLRQTLKLPATGTLKIEVDFQKGLVKAQ
jgi:serine/threonine protein kinase